MNELNVTGAWNELKGKLEQKYAQLADDELLGRLRKNLGQRQDEIRKLSADR